MLARKCLLSVERIAMKQCDVCGSSPEQESRTGSQFSMSITHSLIYEMQLTQADAFGILVDL